MMPIAALLAAALAAEPSTAPAADPEALPPVPLVAATSAIRLPGSVEVALRRDGESRVEPAARFRVVAGAPLADARLVLYDVQESLVPAEEQAEIGSAVSRYTLVPSKPLRPGSRYTLRLEGAAGREIRDLGERRFRPLSFPLLTSGDPPGDRPARRKRRR